MTTLEATISALQREYTLTVTRTPSQYLGMNLHVHPDHSISLSCEKYISKFLQKYPNISQRSVFTPLPTPLPSSGGPSTNPLHDFQGKIGSLLYAATSARPDIQHAVSAISRGVSARSTLHDFCLTRLLAYTIQTRPTFLKYGGNSNSLLQGYCDASFGGNLISEDQRSSYGWIFTLAGSPISWCAKKHDSTSLHTTDAEYMTFREAISQLVHLRSLLEDLDLPQKDATPLVVDCEPAFKVAIGENFSKIMKHINVAVQWVREKIRSKVVELQLVKTTQQGADFLTKGLPRHPHETYCKIVGIHLQRTSPEDSSGKTTKTGGC